MSEVSFQIWQGPVSVAALTGPDYTTIVPKSGVFVKPLFCGT